MSAQPWMKFYPQDWRGEARLRAVSIAARGLWVEMLCLMHEAKPYGHLLLNGHPVTNDQLAALAGTSPDTASSLLAELEGAGVFSRNRSGVIFSRRMRRDYAVSSKQRANVAKRWAKNRNSTPAQDIENTAENGVGNTKSIPTPIPKKPEARSQSSFPSNEEKEQKGGYAFDGRVVRLNRSDFDRWRDAFPSIDLRGLLQSRDDWLSSQPDQVRKRWFTSTSSWLAGKQQDAARIDRAAESVRMPIT